MVRVDECVVSVVRRRRAHSLVWSCVEEMEVFRSTWMVTVVESEVEVDELLEVDSTAQLPRG